MTTLTESKKTLHRSLWMGVLAAVFFSVSFVLNRKIATQDGHWAWSSALRFFMMIPVFALYLSIRKQWGILWKLWCVSPWQWILWGTLGCGVFYATLTAACVAAPAWIVAATWPIAIVIGILLGPLLYEGERRKIPRAALAYSVFILCGVLFLQVTQLRTLSSSTVLIGLLLVLVSATAHPLGNRKSMDLLDGSGVAAGAMHRLCAMIFGSVPFLLILCAWAWFRVGPPTAGQCENILLIAIAGCIATPLFFIATGKVNRQPAALAAVEATQALELVFTLVLEWLLLGIAAPDVWGYAGIFCVVMGMLLHARPPRVNAVRLQSQ